MLAPKPLFSPDFFFLLPTFTCLHLGKKWEERKTYLLFIEHPHSLDIEKATLSGYRINPCTSLHSHSVDEAKMVQIP